MSQVGGVLQASAWYPPHHTGGTEVYLAGLVANLGDLDVTVITPRPMGAPERFEHQGASVRTYPPMALGQTQSRAAFQQLLRESGAAIYHQHSWTPDCGAWHLRTAREAGLRTALTVHVPSSLCLRGTMMRFGESACDGRLDVETCAACWAHSRGAPKLLAQALAQAPTAAAMAFRIPGRLGTALQARLIARERLSDFGEMIANADRVVAVCQWLYDALALNGVPPEKLALSRQGVSEEFLARPEKTRPPSVGARRLLFLGRADPVKGLDVLVRALVNAPALPMELMIHAIVTGPEEVAYLAEVERLAGCDSRIRILDPLPRADIPAAIRAAHGLAVPSTWLETGPLVAMEALAAGTPVMGSTLGGLAELIDRPAKGILVAPGDVSAWTQALELFAAGQFAETCAEPLFTRTMADAAKDMTGLYQDLT